VHKSPIWVKIADFGISKGIDRGETALRSKVGTQEFAAPEVLGILDDGPESSEYTNAVDLWSLGCLLYYLISKCLPFPRPGSLWKYCTGKTEFPESLLKDQRMSTEGILFLKNLMAPQPLDRMSASDALKVPWIRDQSDHQNRANEARDMQTLEASMESLQPNSMNEIKPQMAKLAELKSGHTRPDVLRDPLTDVIKAPTSIAPMNFPQE
jgi:serine/threonine protein kinase